MEGERVATGLDRNLAWEGDQLVRLTTGRRRGGIRHPHSPVQAIRMMTLRRSTLIPSPAALGRSLRRWRLLNRVKQESLAGLVGVAQTTVSRWESITAEPGPREASALLDLLSARPTTASDRALLDLVRSAPRPMHLICDLSHRLLAVSPARERQWRVSHTELLGVSLWRFATPGIEAGETRLASEGWYEPFAEDLTVSTDQADFPELTIPTGDIRYTRLALADGAFARLVQSSA
jgi:transcriptional regulator with XRE-family HTH domain